MSGQTHKEFLGSLPVTSPTDGDKFSRLDETGETQVSSWLQMYEALDNRFYKRLPSDEFVSSDEVRSIAQVTQAEYDALVVKEATRLYLIVDP